jgi:hypothetical protein
MTVKILPPVASLGEFIDQLEARHVRLVKLADYGNVEPVKKGSGYVLQPTIRVVATALDAAAREILSWAVKGEARKMIARAAGTRRGPSPDSERVANKQQARDVLRQLGYDVDEGEWDARSAERVIAALEEATKPRRKVRKPA